jgi:hypothetical protein
VEAPALSGGVIGQITGSSAKDVWAIGAYDYSPARPIALHWDGSAWSEAPQGRMEGWPGGAVAISPSDAWAVGLGIEAPFSMHWDGSRWSQVQVPDEGSYDVLSSVTAVSSTNVWGAGDFTEDGIHPLIVHWDGTAWTRVPAPDGVPHSVNVLYGIAAIAADDVWAVGYQEPEPFNEQPLIEHWDGSSWKVVSTPTIQGTANVLYEVSGTSADDVWAVGVQGDTSRAAALIEHWNGSEWTKVRTPRIAGRDHLLGVMASSPSDAWAVGECFPDGLNAHVLVMHWDGSEWSALRAPTPDNGGLGTVAAIDARDVWAAGSYYDPGVRNSRPLTMHSKGCSD